MIGVVATEAEWRRQITLLKGFLYISAKLGNNRLVRQILLAAKKK